MTFSPFNLLGSAYAATVAGVALSMILSAAEKPAWLDWLTTKTIAGPAAELENVDEVNLFRTELDDTGLRVTTGIRYADVKAVNAGQPEYAWCYVMSGRTGSAADNRISLGQQTGFEAPVYVSADSITREDAALFNLTPSEIAAVAARSCRFPAS